MRAVLPSYYRPWKVVITEINEKFGFKKQIREAVVSEVSEDFINFKQ
jgi:hypothetical protein